MYVNLFQKACIELLVSIKSHTLQSILDPEGDKSRRAFVRLSTVVDTHRSAAVGIDPFAEGYARAERHLPIEPVPYDDSYAAMMFRAGHRNWHVTHDWKKCYEKGE